MSRGVPLWERSEDVLRRQLQAMHESGNYTDSPASHLRELDRRASERDRRETLRLARIALVVSAVGLAFSFRSSRCPEVCCCEHPAS